MRAARLAPAPVLVVLADGGVSAVQAVLALVSLSVVASIVLGRYQNAFSSAAD